jgi:hypothetical protein
LSARKDPFLDLALLGVIGRLYQPLQARPDTNPTGRAWALRGNMDPQVFLAAVVIILVAAIAAWGAVKIAKIKAQSLATGADPATAARFEALEQEVSTLRQEMVEAHERLNFTERVLTQGPEARREGPPKLGDME